MGIDHHDDADPPSGKPADHPPNRPQFETRSREEYYAHAQTGTTWEETAELSRWMWSEYKRRWPPEERPPVDRSNDPPGSWRGDSNRFLDPSANERIETACDRIVEREQTKISPALRATESEDPDRYLIGFEHRLKGRDRIKEKVYLTIKESNRSPEEAVSLVPDTIRYTLQYKEDHYTQGVRADIVRMQEQGFMLKILRNYWSDDQYRGINSQWVEPSTGQRFEVQFHTQISFEAKQLTHGSYERLRTRQADEFEEMVLEAFQKKVASEVPVPPSAAGIPDYPRRRLDAGQDHLLRNN